MRLLVVFAATLTLVLASPAAADLAIPFRTPSGNIGCYYTSTRGLRSALRCDIRSGLKPSPPRPKSCALDWGDSYTLAPTGRTRLTCHGDTAIDPTSRVLRYGTRWSRGGFTCTSRKSGLRCSNRSRHGFLLSRARSYRF
jgi:hypothetical protein